MRFIARRTALLALALFSLTLWAAEAQFGAMVDPLMGLSFDPTMVRFQTFSRSAAADNALGTGTLWIFASHREQVGTVYVVAGFHKVHADGADQDVIEPDFGAVVRTTGKRIKVAGVPDRLFGQNAILPAVTVKRLMSDAADRYVAAFGGAGKLTQTMAAQGLTAEVLPPMLVDALVQKGVNIKASAAGNPTSK